MPSSASQSCGTGAAGTSPECHHQSRPNRVRPNEPNGTRPISTLRPLSRSHSSEPRAMPTENRVSTRVTTVPSPCSQSLAYAGIWVR
ncbi:hypothetical protein D3C76_829040 [compost metagenome]